MKIEIVKQKRKTISLKIINSQHGILKVPTSVSDKKIQEFLAEKESWIKKVSQKMKNNEEFSGKFDLRSFIYINGQKMMTTNEIAIGFENLTEKAKKNAIKKHYMSFFPKLEEMAEKLSNQTGLKFKEIKPADSKRIWGSYNSKKQMKLNYKLVILPEKLVEYVIYHELCHSVHMNHKPQFWKDVEKFCPDYKSLKKDLSHYSFLLKEGE